MASDEKHLYQELFVYFHVSRTLFKRVTLLLICKEEEEEEEALGVAGCKLMRIVRRVSREERW